MPIENYLTDGHSDLRVYLNQENEMVIDITESGNPDLSFFIVLDSQQEVEFLLNQIRSTWELTKQK
jgi:hypothetical protein